MTSHHSASMSGTRIPLRSLLALLTVAYALLWTSAAEAQVRIGPKGGLSLTTVNVKNSVAERYTPRTGVSVGAAVEFPCAGRFRLQVEPSYVQRGSGVEFGPDFGGLRTSSRLDYVTVPALAKVAFQAGPLSPYLMAGPSVGLIVSETYTFGDEPPESSNELARNVDLTVEAEAGLELPLGARRASALSLGVRYSRGLLDISTTDAGSVHTEGVVFLVGGLIRL